ncbi:DUF4142 domain-containing protein [Sorangium sp. So ce260]|uniref:DUF4142 domain-containing protein n=1 Tax=Sorangium sp. So ce260 TaxID=3133291 RepID=UPI003F5EC01A
MAALAIAGASACSVAAEDGNLAAADEEGAEEAVESTSQAFALSFQEAAAVIAAFDATRIAEAQIALTRATDGYVIELAQGLLNHHTAANQQLLAALGQTGVTLRDNPFCQALIEQGASDQQLLERLADPDFDWTYVNLQIHRHREFLVHLREQTSSIGPELHPGLSRLVLDIRNATSRHISFATSVLSLMGTPYVAEQVYPPGAPHYGNSTPSYGSVIYGPNGPYSPATQPYGHYGRSTSLGYGAYSPYSPYRPGPRP